MYSVLQFIMSCMYTCCKSSFISVWIHFQIHCVLMNCIIWVLNFIYCVLRTKQFIIFNFLKYYVLFVLYTILYIVNCVLYTCIEGHFYNVNSKHCNLALLSAWFIYTDSQGREQVVGQILRQIDTCRIYTQTDRYMQDIYLDRQIHVGYILRQIEHVGKILIQIDTRRIDTRQIQIDTSRIS